jgi:hypothetical protein
MLLAASLALMLVTLLITLLVEVPIDNEIREWTGAALPRRSASPGRVSTP